MSLPRNARIVEVSPRDGLQNEKQSVPTTTKIKLMRSLGSLLAEDINCSIAESLERFRPVIEAAKQADHEAFDRQWVGGAPSASRLLRLNFLSFYPRSHRIIME